MDRLNRIHHEVTAWHGVTWRDFLTWRNAAVSGCGWLLDDRERALLRSISYMSELLYLATTDA